MRPLKLNAKGIALPMEVTTNRSFVVRSVGSLLSAIRDRVS
jgi:hypothetical protein